MEEPCRADESGRGKKHKKQKREGGKKRDAHTKQNRKQTLHTHTYLYTSRCLRKG